MIALPMKGTRSRAQGASAWCQKRTLSTDAVVPSGSPTLDCKMYHGDAAGSEVGHVTGNRLTFLRRQRAHQCCLVLELGFEDAEIRRLTGPQGLHIQRIAACLEARQFARK